MKQVIEDTIAAAIVKVIKNVDILIALSIFAGVIGTCVWMAMEIIFG